MINFSAKIKERLTAGIKKFQPVLTKAHASDVNESDTVTIISDMLSDIFGYDKYADITSEFEIKKTFCDLAIKIEDKVYLLIECKAIGLTLKDDFVRQATNYAADAGIDWVVLTNGITWKIYKIIFSKPIEKELVYEFDFRELSSKKQSDLEMLYYLCKESITSKSKSSLEDLHMQKKILNKFILGQLICTDPVIDSLRRQIRKMSPEVKATNEEILKIVMNDIIKREVIEGEQASDAKKKLKKLEKATIKPEAKE